MLEVVYIFELESVPALELKSPLEFDKKKKKTREVEDIKKLFLYVKYQ